MANIPQVAYIIIDDPRERRELAGILMPMKVVAMTFENVSAYFAHARNDAVACVIVDWCPPGMDEYALQRRLLEADTAPVIFISDRGDINSVVRVMKAGAVEFLEKPVSPDSLITAVSAALELDRSNRQRRANIKNLQTRLSILSPREREVLPLVVAGFPNKHTAFILGITEVTLQIHRRQIMRKMAARSFAELVRMASQLDIPIAQMHVRSENL